MKQAEAYLIGGGVALLFHLAVGGSLASVNPSAWKTVTRTNVELEVVEPPPPPPEKEPEPPPPEPKPPERPRLAMRRISPKPPTEAPKPPPTDTPPPETPKETAPPVFGVTLDSTVTGEAAMAVPVGDTVGTNDRTPRKPNTAPAPSEGPPAFAPVPESYIAKMPQLISRDPIELEGQRGGRGVYPQEALRLGIDGTVVLRVGIDRSGKIRSVRVVKKVGYGLDEAAIQSMWRYKWSPAVTNDGRPVDFLITFDYKFRPPQ
jgi:protein TonB